MRVSFTLPDSAAQLLRMSAARLKLATGQRQSEASIARALVMEVLIDDAEAHGLVQCKQGVN